METKEIERRLEKQIARLELLKGEIESREGEVTFAGHDRDRSFAGLMDSETLEAYTRDYEKFRHIIHKRGFGLNNRRSEMEIVANILDIARQGVNKTKILYKANLSYIQLKNYVGFLLEKGLLERIGRTYSTTKKGTLFLITWQNTLLLLE
ncbi:MAG: winged helix-turn-helix domain-containing protein [Candidatus Hydrothermarchaeaceae archaeon]